MSDTLARRIHNAAFLSGEFTLRSGQITDHYFDKYQFEADPELLKAVCEAMQPMLPDADFLAGIEMGGIPIATVLSQMTGRPALFVRKTAKQYGTAKLAEGADFAGTTLLLVEDVVTSGGQLLKSAEQLRDLGALITDAVCVIDRESGGTAHLAEAGIRLHALFTDSDLTR